MSLKITVHGMNSKTKHVTLFRWNVITVQIGKFVYCLFHLYLLKHTVCAAVGLLPDWRHVNLLYSIILLKTKLTTSWQWQGHFQTTNLREEAIKHYENALIAHKTEAMKSA